MHLDLTIVHWIKVDYFCCSDCLHKHVHILINRGQKSIDLVGLPYFVQTCWDPGAPELPEL